MSALESAVIEPARAVEQGDLDPSVSVLVLSGDGKGFCGGDDLVQSAENQGQLEGESEPGSAVPAGSPLDPSAMRADHDPGPCRLPWSTTR